MILPYLSSKKNEYINPQDAPSVAPNRKPSTTFPNNIIRRKLPIPPSGAIYSDAVIPTAINNANPPVKGAASMPRAQKPYLILTFSNQNP